MTIATVLPGIKFFNLTNPELKLVKTVDLPTYNDEFYRTNADNVEFIVPTFGTQHTTNTIYARCEYRETLENSTNLNNWDAAAQPENWMEYVIQVNDPGFAEKLIVGQIHGKSTHPIFKCQWKKGKLYAQFREYLNAGDVDVYLADMPLGEKTKIRISLDGNFFLTITVNGEIKYQAQANRQSYKDDRFYFKVGAYVQTEIDTAESVANVKLYALNLFHGERVAVALPRTITDLSRDVAAALAGYQDGTLTSEVALAQIETLKVEADTNFSVSDERKALYTQIVGARNVIRAVPVEPTLTDYQLIDVELDTIKAEFQAGSLALSAAKSRLVAASAKIKALTEAADRLTLNAKAAELKAILV